MLIGRAALLGSILAALERGPVVLKGPPGVGKTSLLRAVAAVRAPGLVLAGVPVLSTVPYLPVRVARPHADASLAPGPLADALVAASAGDAVATIDDLQWCDVDTLALVGELVYRRPTLATVRSVPGPAGSLIDDLASLGTVVEVGPLDEAAAAELVLALRPTASVADVAQCLETGRGLPLELELAALGQGDGWDGVAEAVGALDPEALDLLAGLAIAGTDAEAQGAALHQLVGHGLVVPVGEGRWRPRHERFGAAAIDSIGSDRAGELHRLAAGRSTDPAVRAVHLSAAGCRADAALAAARAADEAPTISSRAQALGIEVACTDDPSTELVLQAADAWSRAGRYDEAIALLDACPAAAAGTGAAVLARACWATTDIDRCRAAVAATLDALGSDDGDLAAEMLSIRSRILCRTDWDIPGAVAAAQDGIARAPGPGPGLIGALTSLGLAHLMAGEGDWASELEAAGRMAVTEDDLHQAVVVYDTVFFGHLLSGDPRRCPEIADEAIRATEGASAAWNGYFRAVSLLARVHVLADHAGVLADSGLLVRRPLTIKSREAARTARIMALIDGGRELDAIELAESSLVLASDDSARSMASWALAEAAWLGGEARRSFDVAVASLDLNAAGFAGAVNAALLGLWAATDLELAHDERLVAATRSGFANFAGVSVEADALVALPDDPWAALERFEEAQRLWSACGVRSALRARWGAAIAAYRAGAPDRVELHLRALEAEGHRLDLPWVRRRVAAGLRITGLKPDPAFTSGAPMRAEVLRRVARGQTTQAISRSLAIRPATVEDHIRGAMVRTGARTRLHAAVLEATAEAAAEVRVVLAPDGRASVTSAGISSESRRVPVGSLPAVPWHLGDAPVLVGQVDGAEQLSEAVLAVARGADLDLTVASGAEPVLAALLDGLRRIGRQVGAPEEGLPALDPEDRRLVDLMADGRTAAEIAAILGYSRRTVQRRMERVRLTLGASSNREAVSRSR